MPKKKREPELKQAMFPFMWEEDLVVEIHKERSERGTKRALEPKKVEAPAQEKAEEKAQKPEEAPAQEEVEKTEKKSWRNLIEQIPIIKPREFYDPTKIPDKEKDELRRVKEAVKELERNNYDKIIIFESGWPWYEAAFNSVLIYKYRVQPYLSREYFHLRTDNDFHAYSKYGIISIIDVVAFGDALVKLGAKPPETLAKFYDGSLPKDERLKKKDHERMYVFELGGLGLTITDVEKYVESEIKDQELENILVMPNYIPQDLYRDLHRLGPVVTSIVRRLPPEVRSTVGQKMFNDLTMMLTSVNVACNGYGGKEDLDFIKALNYVVYLAAELQEITKVVEDSRLVKPGECHVLVKLTVLIQKDVEDEMKRLQRGGSETVRKIRNMKDFPQHAGIALSNIIPDKDVAQGFIEPLLPKMELKDERISKEDDAKTIPERSDNEEKAS